MQLFFNYCTMNKGLTLRNLLTPYKGKLLFIVFVNLISVFFTVFSLLWIDPIVKIIFHQDRRDTLNPVGNLLFDILNKLGVDITETRSLFLIILLMLFLYLLKNLFQYLSFWLMAPVRSGLISTLRDRLYHQILILPLSYFTEQKKGDLMSRAVNDTQEIEFTIIKSLQQFLIEPFSLLFFLVTLFVLDFKLTLFVLLLLPVAGLVISFISRSLRRRSRKAKTILGNLISIVEETIQGLKVIKSANAQKFSQDKFNDTTHTFAQEQKKIYRIVDLASPLSEVLGVIVVMVILVFGGVKVLSHDTSLTPGLFIAYIALFVQIINPAKNLATAFSNYKRGTAVFDRINEIFTADEVICEKENAIAVSSFKKEIVLENVSFSYSDKSVLTEVNVTFEKGKMVAIVGPSGAGKSTLVDLLPRFYDVTAGKILLDGVDIRDLRIEDLRLMFSIVSQDIVLFNDTIFNNIAFGLTGVGEEEVMKALKVAYADRFVAELPDGIFTQIADRGLSLSGGQRQRLSIARAVLRNAPVLILDEATSAIDTESEKLVQAALDEMMRDKTTIAIAHRFSTIQHADRILVLDNGRIIESGTHRQLMELGGKYASLVEINSFQ